MTDWPGRWGRVQPGRGSRGQGQGRARRRPSSPVTGIGHRSRSAVAGVGHRNRKPSAVSSDIPGADSEAEAEAESDTVADADSIHGLRERIKIGQSSQRLPVAPTRSLPHEATVLIRGDSRLVRKRHRLTGCFHETRPSRNQPCLAALSKIPAIATRARVW